MLFEARDYDSHGPVGSHSAHLAYEITSAASITATRRYELCKLSVGVHRSRRRAVDLREYGTAPHMREAGGYRLPVHSLLYDSAAATPDAAHTDGDALRMSEHLHTCR